MQESYIYMRFSYWKLRKLWINQALITAQKKNELCPLSDSKPKIKILHLMVQST